MTSHPTLGFLGTGRIAGALVEGFCTGGTPPRILVSPRNEARSRQLAERFPQVRRAGSNQEVLDGSDVVFLALRPATLAEAMPGLRFRPDHRVISLVATLSVAEARAMVQPAARVIKVLPLASVARRLGPISLFPDDPGLAAVLAQVGEPQPATSEAELQRLWTVTGLISTYYAQLDAIHGWCVRAGVQPEVAQTYLVGMMAALTRMAEGGESLAALAREAATPGGLNEMALASLRRGTLFPDLEAVLDAILARIEPEAG